jgi:signal peptidase II
MRQQRATPRSIWLVPSLLAASIIIVDQLTKAWIWRALDGVEGASIPLLGHWLKFTLVHNTGVAFGMFQNFPQFFTFTSVIISIGAIYFYRYHLPNHMLVIQVCLGMIIGGAIGNIIDRIRLNYVIDFVHVAWFPGIFNVADSMITVGTLMLAGFLLFLGDRPERPATDDDALLRELLTGERVSNSGDRPH